MVRTIERSSQRWGASCWASSGPSGPGRKRQSNSNERPDEKQEQRQKQKLSKKWKRENDTKHEQHHQIRGQSKHIGEPSANLGDRLSRTRDLNMLYLPFAFRFSKALRLQNLTAVNPSGSPSGVVVKLEYRLIPRVVKYTDCQWLSLLTRRLW